MSKVCATELSPIVVRVMGGFNDDDLSDARDEYWGDNHLEENDSGEIGDVEIPDVIVVGVSSTQPSRPHEQPIRNYHIFQYRYYLYYQILRLFHTSNSLPLTNANTHLLCGYTPRPPLK